MWERLKDLRLPDYSGKSGGLWAEGQRWFRPPFIKWLNRLSLCPLPSVLSAQDNLCGKNLDFIFFKMSSWLDTCPFVHCCWNAVLFISPLSDAFDFQFGAVILRLKEGLDVSHIQGQGKEESVSFWNKAGINGMEAMWFSGTCCPRNLVIPTEPQRFWL